MSRQLAFFIFSSICLLFASTVAAEQSRLQPRADKSLLLDIIDVRQQFLVAVGERGHVLISKNAQDWQQIVVPTTSTLTKVFFINEQLGWAVGHDATIIHTKDGGITWQLQYQDVELQRPLFDIVFKNEMEGIAVGAYGLFYQTMNGGESWQKIFHEALLNEDDAAYLDDLKQEDEQAYQNEVNSILPHFNRLYAKGDALILVGEIGFYATSDDFGSSWTKPEKFYQGSLFSAEVLSNNEILVSGLRGHVFKSSNQHDDWVELKTQTTALLNDMVIAKNSIYLIGNAGVILTSKDNGQTFSLTTLKDGKSLVAGTVFNDKLVLVSEVGIKTLAVNSL